MSIRIYAPATVANVVCGFDILGLALETPGDIIEVEQLNTNAIRFLNETNYTNLPQDPKKNCLTVSVIKLLEHLKIERGFEIRLLKKIKPGSGLGSSAASSVAGVFAVNKLLGEPLTQKELIPFAMYGEEVACGNKHADNISPALLGGIVLIRSTKPLDIIALDYPKDLYCGVIHPQIELKTAHARKILSEYISLKDAITQWGNIAGLITGFLTKDYDLIRRSMQDVVIEPLRSLLIPSYDILKNEALKSNILGCSIAGSGPTMMILSQEKKSAEKALASMQKVLNNINIKNHIYLSHIRPKGVEII